MSVTPAFYSARQRVIILTFRDVETAEQWDTERRLDDVTVTIQDVTRKTDTT